MMLRPANSTLFPYTTLFRSVFAKSSDSWSPAIKATSISRRSWHAALLSRCNDSLLTANIGSHNPDVGGTDIFCRIRSEEHTSELQSHVNLVCRLLLEKKKTN